MRESLGKGEVFKTPIMRDKNGWGNTHKDK